MKKNKITEQEKAQEFVEKYNELCQKYGYQWQVNPSWRYSQDGNDWRLILQPSVSKLPENE